jgi:hypothetical protein
LPDRLGGGPERRGEALAETATRIIELAMRLAFRHSEGHQLLPGIRAEARLQWV